MKKEYTLVGLVFALMISYLIDSLSGTVVLTGIDDPSQFLTPFFLRQYPFTALSVLIKTLSLVATVILLFSFMKHSYFKKAGVTTFLAVLIEFYAVQQLTTGGTITPVIITLSLAYSGILLILPAIYYLLKGIVYGLHTSLGGKKNIKDTNSPSEDEE